VPPNHHAHYYSNPSYHTLSQCTLPAPGPGAQDRASSLKVRHGAAPAAGHGAVWGWTALHGVVQCITVLYGASTVLYGASQRCKVHHGVVRCFTVLYSASRCCRVLHGVIWCTTALHRALWCRTVRHSVVRSIMVLYAVSRCCTAHYGVVRCITV